MRLPLLLVLVACSRGASPPPPPGLPAPSATLSAPTPSAPTPPDAEPLAPETAAPHASTTPRVLPRVATTCRTDADCTITSDELVDHPPRTYACCPGCTQVAVSTASLAAFQAACEKQPAPMCPPIGCVQPIVRAACAAGHCVVKQAATP